MMTSLHKIFCFGAGFILLLVTGCYELPTEPVSEDAGVGQPGFKGKVSGTVKTEISGPGVVTYLRSQNTIDGVRSGYYWIANGRGAKDPLLTFGYPPARNPVPMNWLQPIQWSWVKILKFELKA